MLKEPLTVGRTPDSQGALRSRSLGLLPVTGALFFWWAQMVRGAPTALTRFFCRFPHRFCDFCEVFGCFRRRFGPRGPENP